MCRLIQRLHDEDGGALHNLGRTYEIGPIDATHFSGWIEAGSVRSTREVADAGRDERDQWRREFARIGNNLNQLTRAVHVAEANGTAVGFPVARELERVATEMRALRAQVERTLR